jgi:acetate kinase
MKSASRVSVRVIPTDEEFMIAKTVWQLLAAEPQKEI